MGIIKAIIEKSNINDLVAILLVGSLGITIIPNDWIIKLGLVGFINKYKMYISLCLILCSSYYLIILLKKLLHIIYGKLHSWKKTAIRYMKNDMSASEMQLLIEKFYDKDNNVFRSSDFIEYSDGRKAALESKKIIYLASQISQWYSFAYNLQPYALKFLNKNLAEGNIKIEPNRFEYILK